MIILLAFSLAKGAAADSSTDAVRTQLIEAMRLSLEADLSRYMHQDGLLQFDDLMTKWIAQNPKASSGVRDWQALRDGYARQQARLLLKRHVPVVTGEMQSKLDAAITGNKNRLAASAVQYVKTPIFQAMLVDDHVTGFIDLLGAYQTNKLEHLKNPSALEFVSGDETSSTKIPAIFQKNPATQNESPSMKTSDYLPGEFDLQWSNLADLEKDRPSFLRANAERISRMGKNFAVQSALFNTATGLVQVAQLGLDYSKDPLAFDKFVNSLKDPATNVGFAAFMATNHKLTLLLSGVMTGKISRALLPYIGMSAGLIASNLVSDIWNDADLHKCVASHFNEIKSCDIAFEKWVTGSKINHYAPAIISLCSTTLFATVIKVAVLQGQPVVRVAMKGMRLLPALPRVAANGLRLGLEGLGPEGALGANLIFLGVSQALSAYVDPWMARFSTAQFDLYEFLKRNTVIGRFDDGLHLLFFGNIKMPTIEEASTMSAALHNMQQTYKNLEAKMWQELDASECSQGKASWSTYESDRNKISQCITTSDLAASITQYSIVNKKWRQTLLSTPLASETAWKEALFDFSVLYIGSNAVYTYYIESLHAQLRGEANYDGKPIDLSPAALNRVLQDVVNVKPVKDRSDEENEALAGLYPTHIRAAATPELLDYIVASMLCGPQAEGKPTLAQYATSMSWVHHVLPFMYKNVPTPVSPLVSTPAGSALRFYPPNITSLDGSACDLGPIGSSGHIVKQSAQDMNPKNLFEDRWQVREENKVYEGILPLITSHVRPDLIAADKPAAAVNIWWDQTITPAAQAAWVGFEGGYKIFLQKQFYPALVTRQMRVDGFCFGQKEALSGDGTFDPRGRLSCGVYHSMELELRQYMSILRGIYLSSFEPPKQAAADQEFTQLARQLITVFRSHSTLNVLETSFALEDANGPFAAIANHLSDVVSRADHDVRLDAAVSVIKAIKAVIQERAEYGRMMTVLDFDNQSVEDGPPVKSNSSDIRGRMGSGN